MLSGGVLQRDVLFSQIQAKTVEYLGGYIDVPRAKQEVYNVQNNPYVDVFNLFIFINMNIEN